MRTITVGQRTAQAKGRAMWTWVAGVGALVLVVLAAGGVMMWRMSYVPADLNLSTTRTSAQGHFIGTIQPSGSPIPLNTLHHWTLHVETPDGQPVDNATITVDGDMPQHGHGLPTQPLVTTYLGNGDYVVEGMKFQMTGWWYVEFAISSAGQQDTVRFDMILK